MYAEVGLLQGFGNITTTWEISRFVRYTNVMHKTNILWMIRCNVFITLRDS